MSFKNQIYSFVKASTFWKNRELRTSDYHRPILSEADGNLLLRSNLLSDHPFMAARLGATELNCLRHFMGRRKRCKSYPQNAASSMGTLSGFFPQTDEALDDFCKVYLDALRQADIMGVWFNIGENRFVKEYCPTANLVRLRALEPYYHSEPWSKALQGKQVLVIHPFAESIREQYTSKRDLIFKNADVLPVFELHTIKAVQSVAGAPTRFTTWFEALDSMKSDMDSVNYDVCIVGAGAYGLPLAAHAKSMGKQAVHIGGATQILFGIKGKRWDDHESISTLFNDAWIRPMQSETPAAFHVVEDGCYW